MESPLPEMFIAFVYMGSGRIRLYVRLPRSAVTSQIPEERQLLPSYTERLSSCSKSLQKSSYSGGDLITSVRTTIVAFLHQPDSLAVPNSAPRSKKKWAVAVRTRPYSRPIVDDFDVFWPFARANEALTRTAIVVTFFTSHNMLITQLQRSPISKSPPRRIRLCGLSMYFGFGGQRRSLRYHENDYCCLLAPKRQSSSSKSLQESSYSEKPT